MTHAIREFERPVDGKAPRPRGTSGAIYDLIADMGDWCGKGMIYVLAELPARRPEVKATTDRDTRIANGLYYLVHHGYVDCRVYFKSPLEYDVEYRIAKFEDFIDVYNDQGSGRRRHNDLITYLGRPGEVPKAKPTGIYLHQRPASSRETSITASLDQFELEPTGPSSFWIRRPGDHQTATDFDASDCDNELRESATSDRELVNMLMSFAAGTLLGVAIAMIVTGAAV